MNIRIVCYEDLDTWIIGKIAKRLNEALVRLGHSASVGKGPDATADVNHHMTAFNYPGCSDGLHTLMVTHVDNAVKLRKLQEGLQTARAAICMSLETELHLAAMGLKKEQLTYANMGHDGKAKERRYAVGLCTRLYPDGRKREADVAKLLDYITPRDFSFKIMGFGWAPIVKHMRHRGYEVEYHQDFDYDKYLSMLSALDYFLYLGRDEGSAAFIDALAAGVKTIVEPQGFHLDAVGGITHSVRNFEDLKQVFLGIAAEKQSRISAVKEWTWENYARRHVQIWETCRSGKPLLDHGIVEWRTGQPSTAANWKIRLWTNYIVQRVRMVLNMRKDYECGSRFWIWRNARDKK